MERIYSERFCRIYDEYGWNYYPETFGALLLEWIREQKVTFHKALDLGCGTGILCDILYKEGIEPCGLDLSGGMIAIAREHFPHIRFEQGDMTVYAPGEAFDLVTSTCDAINHLPEIEDLRKTFERVREYLAPEGYFIFDLLKEDEVVPCEAVELGQTENELLEFEIRKEGDLVTLETSVYTEAKGTRTLVSREEVHERIYEPGLIRKLLEEAGFTHIEMRDHLPESGGQGTAWFFVVKLK